MGELGTVLVTVALGLVLLVGAVVAVYLNGLVRNAYNLRVTLQKTVDDQLRAAQDETEKKVRWLRRELVEEVERMREALIETNQRRLAEFVEKIQARVDEFEKSGRNERMEVRVAVDDLKEFAARLDGRIDLIGHETRALAEALQRALALDGKSAAVSLVIPPDPLATQPTAASPPTSNAA